MSEGQARQKDYFTKALTSSKQLNKIIVFNEAWTSAIGSIIGRHERSLIEAKK